MYSYAISKHYFLSEPPSSGYTFPDIGWRSSDSSGAYLSRISVSISFNFSVTLSNQLSFINLTDYAEATREGHSKTW